VNPRALVVEDDQSVRAAITLVLQRAGFGVESVPDGRSGLARLDDSLFDLVILDLMLPGMSGFDVCREIRARSGIPIVMVTARADTADVVAGLELGADDYVTKPFEAAELAARARAAVRRAVDTVPAHWSIRDLDIDEPAFSVSRFGDEIALSATEFRLLVTLARHAGQVMTREVLLERVWGYDYLGDSRLVDMAMRRLRSKLGEPGSGGEYVTTIRSIGYRFERA
jgi:two-component system, OmpR family, response regulator MtrA